MAGAADLLHDDRFKDIASRRANLEALTDAVDTVMSADTTAGWMARLGGKVPFASVLDIAQALDNPYVTSIGMVETVDHPDTADGLRTLGSPFRINGKRVTSRRAPKLGENTDELLHETRRSESS